MVPPPTGSLVPGSLSAVPSTSVRGKSSFATPPCGLLVLLSRQQNAITVQPRGRLVYVKVGFKKVRLMVLDRRGEKEKLGQPVKDNVENPGPIIH